MKRAVKKYVSATQTKNFMMNDHLVDYLKFRKSMGLTTREPLTGGGSSTGLSTPRSRETSPRLQPVQPLNNILANKGIEYEKRILRCISAEYPVKSVSEMISDDSVEQVKALMRERVPIIHSAPLRDDELRAHGIADFIVRNDYLLKLSPSSVGIVPNDEYYSVIDVKLSTIPFRSDKTHILNSGAYPAYKAQLYVYAHAIGLIQNRTSTHAYVIGAQGLERLGVVDFADEDSDIPEKTERAIEWCFRVETEGADWSLSPPSIRELYPNMCVESYEWNDEKKRIAQELGELTLLWNVGVKERNRAHDLGVKSWRSEECSSHILGIKKERGRVIDCIINTNHGTQVITPKRVQSNLYDWRSETEEAFIDFEYTSSCIFMIGVFRQRENTGTYTPFTCRTISLEEEARVLSEFFENIRHVKRCWYWHADQTALRSAMRRHPTLSIPNVEFCDLYKLFVAEPICIKGCFKFSLKNIVECASAHGLIETKLTSECKSGFIATLKASELYEQGCDVSTDPVFRDIQEYNRFDVIVLHDLLSLLRKKL
jgi:hypothetical protein